MLLTESDLDDYPGLFLNASPREPQLRSVLATYPRTVENPSGYNNQQQIVIDREKFIARTDGTRSFPWRIAIVTKDDAGLLLSDMVHSLGPLSKIADTSWIRPGQVAWDWWHALNLYGVDFEAGINTRTYKYYIDFAARSGLEYILIDDGWSVNGPADLMQVVPELDLEEPGGLRPRTQRGHPPGPDTHLSRTTWSASCATMPRWASKASRWTT